MLFAKRLCIKYLGLLLGLQKSLAAQLKPVVDRATLVRTTLSTIVVHVLMSLDILVKNLEAFRRSIVASFGKAAKT
jgi:hypothetical protein